MILRIPRKFFIWFFVSTLVVILGGEVFARYYLGLGTPPISITHPKIEYMFKPNQDVFRLGNRIIINEYGMRTASFPITKPSGETRIMVFGDSVLNGGNQTDHADLATTLLQERIRETKQNVVVGNISAGSWGPSNWLEYSKEYGFFGADIVVLVISSHDYADIPTFEALNENTHPTTPPISALIEGITRYLPRYLPQLNTGVITNESDRFADKVNESEAVDGLRDLKSFLQLAQKQSKNVFVFQHWEREEIEAGSSKDGNQLIKKACESIGISPISLEPYFRQSSENGNSPYRDNIHPNKIGQELIAKAIFENISREAMQRTR